MKVKICPKCGQAFSTTAAGLELLYSHLLHEHALPAGDGDESGAHQKEKVSGSRSAGVQQATVPSSRR